MEKEASIKFTEADILQGDHAVLRNVNLTINKGEFVYLIGKVGSGKSSLIKTIYAEIPLTKGEGEAAGFDLRKLKKSQVPYLRRRLGIVFQDFQLLTDRSVFANLEFVLRATGWKNQAEIKKRVEDVLEKVGVANKGYKMTHQLSGGEQQRVSIARALLNEPEIILADEPTGNLDPEASEEILKLLMEISYNERTVVMATHNYTLLKRFVARTLKCEKGQLEEIDQSQEIEFSGLME
ncbi:MAG TPA: ATP-binding cassette domain-containing protein [Bacteroidales bacterium]|nr:ATP-binding cassette domain-containing protein [Bacteroidales bacterium]